MSTQDNNAVFVYGHNSSSIRGITISLIIGAEVMLSLCYFVCVFAGHGHSYPWKTRVRLHQQSPAADHDAKQGESRKNWFLFLCSWTHALLLGCKEKKDSVTKPVYVSTRAMDLVSFQQEFLCLRLRRGDFPFFFFLAWPQKMLHTIIIVLFFCSGWTFTKKT